MADRSAGKRSRDFEQDHPSRYHPDDHAKRKRHDDGCRSDKERDRDRERDSKEKDRTRDRDRDRDVNGDRRGSPGGPRHRRGVGYDESRRHDSGRHHRREGDKDREHRHRTRSRDRERPRQASPARARASKPPKVDTARGTPVEREEGEISPIAPTPPSRSTSPGRSQGTPGILADVPKSAPVLDPLPEIELESPQQLSTDQLLEERRARRAAILAKYSAQPSAMTSSVNSPAPGTPNMSQATTPNLAGGESVVLQTAPAPPDTPMAMVASRSASPAAGAEFSLAKDADATQHVVAGQLDQQERSAADYDPSADRQHDEDRRFGQLAHGETMEVDEVEVVQEVEDDDEDMDDLFAIGTPVEKTKTKTVRKVVKASMDVVDIDAAADAEGYYAIRLGEALDEGRYQVTSTIGKGMFSNVVRAKDTSDADGREIAIKIVRAQETMKKAGLKEISILNKIRAADPDDKRHFVRLERTFEHRGHLCLVFESLNMNLREVVKRFGKDVGLSLSAVRAYSNQLFVALALLRKLNLMHADLKPDNILVGENKALLKVCDLGSATDVLEGAGGEVTPYLVSRFYRAPEIILGLPYDAAIDVWSVGCTLYELYTGKILFPGRSNAHMLLLMTELRGRFNTKIVRRARFADTYFDELGAFVHPDAKTVTAPRMRDLKARLMPPGERYSDTEAKALSQFVDLLEKCLMLDPSRRITPREALAHGFLRG